MRYICEWDVRKAKGNLRKHGISFEGAAAVFNDVRAISVFDNEHSEQEDRWITLGMDGSANLVVAVHTYSIIDDSTRRVRIISARKATKSESRQYWEDKR